MEQLYNAMLANAQFSQAVLAVKKTSAAPDDGFQKLMEQKADSTAEAKPEGSSGTPDAAQKTQSQNAQSTQKSQEAGQTREEAAPKSEKELEEQLSLAAMAMLYNPVVPMEEVMTPEGVQIEVPVEAVAEELVPAAVMENAAVMPETVAAPVEEAVLQAEPEAVDMELTRPVEAPVEKADVPADVQPLAEELPQTIQAPEASSEAQEQSVEVRTEVGHQERAVETVEAAEKPEKTEDAPELQGAEIETPVFEDVKAVPVKVGEAPKSEETAETENIGEQIGAKMIQITSVTGESGDQKITVNLTPENLGKVQVEVSLSKDGTLHVTVNAENSRTQNLLDRNSDTLAAILGKYAEKEVQVNVPRQEESQQRQDLYEQQQNQHKRHQQERQEQRRSRQNDSVDFLQQLRLGLIPMDGE